MDHVLNFYKKQSQYSEPGIYQYLYDGTTFNIEELVKTVQGVLIHEAHFDKYLTNIYIDDKRFQERELRTINEMLNKIFALDKESINVPRHASKKLIGCCRHFSLLLCSLLRYHKIPTRVRSGFATYLDEDGYENHYLCEYWNSSEDRWILIDPQLDDILKDFFQINFNPLDITEKEFIQGSKAWDMCIKNEVDTSKFRVYGGPSGINLVKETALHDFLCLNKVELLPWDNQGFIGEELHKYDSSEQQLLNEIMELCLDENTNIQKIYSVFKTNKLFSNYW